MRPRSAQISRRCAALLMFALALVLPTCAAVASPAGAGSPAQHRVALTTSLVTPFFRAYVLEATLRVSSAFGLLASGSYLSLQNPKQHVWETHAATVAAGLDYYLPLGAPRRVYLEAVEELVFASWHHRPSGQVAPLGIGNTLIALVGYRYIWPSGPVLDLGAGAVAIHFPRARVELADGGSASSVAFTNVYPALKLNVGWAF